MRRFDPLLIIDGTALTVLVVVQNLPNALPALEWKTGERRVNFVSGSVHK